MKIAGRDSNKKCVIIEEIDEYHVMIDGETRRKKCNIKHLEFLDEKLDIRKGAEHQEIVAAFKKIGIELKEKKAKTVYTKPLKKRILKTRAQMDKKAKQKTEKKEKKTEDKKPETKEKETTKIIKKKPLIKKEEKPTQ